MTATAVNANTAPEVTLFLEALFAGKPDDLLHLLLWTLPEKRSHWFQNVESAIQFAESMRQRDLYVGVGLSGQDYGSSRRCPSNEVAGIVGLWADLDLKSDAHPKAALPATIEDATEDPAGTASTHLRGPDRKRRTCLVALPGAADLRVRRGTPRCRKSRAPLAVASPSERGGARLGV